MGGLYVLDLDGKTPSTFGHLPMTAIVKTGRPNGWHYYFTHSRELKTFSFGRIGSLQGAGSYVVAAGSIHPSGAVYEYADGLSLEQIEITPLPDWLADGRKRKKYIPNFKGPATSSEASRAPTPTDCINPGEEDLSSPFYKPIKKVKQGMVKRYTITRFIFSDPKPEQVKLFGKEQVALDIMRLCGREGISINKAFTCPLPGHDDTKPSAALFKRRDDGLIMLHDFHGDLKLDQVDEHTAGFIGEVNGVPNCVVWWPLPDVYAASVTGKALLLGRGERRLWGLRALHQTGYLTPPTLKRYPLPEVTRLEGVIKTERKGTETDSQKVTTLTPYRIKTDTVSKLYDSFVYMMELRQLYGPDNEGAPFSWRFAADWSGINSPATIQKAMNWLLKSGYIYDTKNRSTRQGLTLFKLGIPREGGIANELNPRSQGS